MFDFQTAHAGPVRVTVDGTLYEVPLFMLPQFKAWCAVREKASIDAAMKELGDDADKRAQFMLYWQPTPVDVLQMLQYAGTPEGVEYVLSTQLKAAGVPDDKVRSLLDNVKAATLYTLLDRILGAKETRARMASESQDPGPRGNPTTGQSPTSGDSPTTTAPTSPDSTEATAA